MGANTDASELVQMEAAAPDMASVLIDRLAAKEQARKAEVEKRRQEAAELNNPEESIASFLSTFASMQAAVLASVAETQRAGPSQPGAMQQLDDALAQVIALEASTSQAAYFLPAYDLRQCTCAIQDIKGRVEEVRGELAPKKKFSFSKKVTRTKANELTMAPSTTGDTSAVATDAATGAPQPAAISPQDLAQVEAGRGLRGLTGQVVVKGAEEVAGHDYVLIDLQDCTVYLLGSMPALRMHNLKNCTIVTGPVTGGTFANNMQHCRLYLASYQVRIHLTTDTDFYLRVRSRPIIEHTSRVRFAPYPMEALGLEPAAAAARLSPQEGGLWEQVEDFAWIKAQQSPHWAALPEAERQAPPLLPK